MKISIIIQYISVIFNIVNIILKVYDMYMFQVQSFYKKLLVLWNRHMTLFSYLTAYVNC